MIGWNEEVIIRLVAPAWEWALFFCLYAVLSYPFYKELVVRTWRWITNNC